MARHIIGFIVGIVLAPVLPYILRWAAHLATRTFSMNFGATGLTVAAMGVLLLIGAVAGAMTSMRWLSPVAALVTAIPLLALTVTHLAGVGGELLTQLPVGVFSLTHQGIFAALGALLVVSALSPQRWRGKENNAAPDPSYLRPPPMPQQAGQPRWASEPASYGPGGFTPPSGPPGPPDMPPDEGSPRP